MPDLAYYENLRDQLVEGKYQEKLYNALNDIKSFDEIDSGYEVMIVNSGQIQRALRNLDDAIAGKEYAQDAVYTALNIILEFIKTICREEAEKEMVSAEEDKFNQEKFGGDLP